MAFELFIVKLFDQSAYKVGRERVDAVHVVGTGASSAIRP